MCSDVCINDDGGYSCQCPSGKTLSKNDLQCGGMASYYHIAPLLLNTYKRFAIVNCNVCFSCVCAVCIHDGREYLLGDRVKIGCNWWYVCVRF